MDMLTRVRVVGDQGLVTAEYAMCGFAATSFAVVLYEFLTSPKVHEILLDVFSSLLRWPF